jgi:hypothetical protein
MVGAVSGPTYPCTNLEGPLQGPDDPQEFAGQHLHLSKVTVAPELKQILTTHDTSQKHLDIAFRCITLQDKQANTGLIWICVWNIVRNLQHAHICYIYINDMHRDLICKATPQCCHNMKD